MGKGTIQSGGPEGLYQVTINYDRTSYELQLTTYNETLVMLQEKYDAFPPPEEMTDKQKLEKSVVGLQIVSVEKAIDNLETNFKEDETKSAWCADLTEDVAGTVRTVEVPGESEFIQIYPGYDGEESYDAARDGQLVQTYNMDYAGVFYNLAMLPGWQKWMPTYRYGNIVSIDSNTTATVTVQDIRSSQQDININQATTLSGITVKYMSCNALAFEVDDEVLIEFEEQDWTKPRVIGFREDPKTCDGYIYITAVAPDTPTLCIVWDVVNDEASTTIPLNTGGVATFPVAASEISDWKALRVEHGEDLFTGDGYQTVGDSSMWDKGQNACLDYNLEDGCGGCTSGTIYSRADVYDENGNLIGNDIDSDYTIYACPGEPWSPNEGGLGGDEERTITQNFSSEDIGSFQLTTQNNISKTCGLGSRYIFNEIDKKWNTPGQGLVINYVFEGGHYHANYVRNPFSSGVELDFDLEGWTDAQEIMRLINDCDITLTSGEPDTFSISKASSRRVRKRGGGTSVTGKFGDNLIVHLHSIGWRRESVNASVGYTVFPFAGFVQGYYDTSDKITESEYNNAIGAAKAAATITDIGEVQCYYELTTSVSGAWDIDPFTMTPSSALTTLCTQMQDSLISTGWTSDADAARVPEFNIKLLK